VTAPRRADLSLGAVRLLNFVTNHVVSAVPSYALRHAWYRRLGLQIAPGAGIHLGCYVWFYGPGHLRRTGLTIGRNTRVNRGCTLDGRGSLTIGDEVSISPEVVILTTQHAWRTPGFPLESRPVVIEDHVWIGMRATVLPGTTIGRGAVVAAGAVVSGTVPPLAVVAGVPARQVAERPEPALAYTFADAPFPALE
jgi:maltose O-acetyltransferase